MERNKGFFLFVYMDISASIAGTFLNLDSLSFRVWFFFVCCVFSVCGCFVFDVEVQRAVGNIPISLEAEGFF